MTVNYKLCYSGDIQTLFGLLRKKTGDSGDDDVLKTTLNSLGMTLKCWKTTTGYYRVLKYARTPLQCMYSAQTVVQQLAYEKNRADDSESTVASADASIQGRGLYRSVVINDVGNIVAFSPPKTVACNDVADITALDSLSVSDFSASFSSVEEFVEGTMITLFYNSSPDASCAMSGWEISTKGVVGGGIFVPKPNANRDKEKSADSNKAVDESTSTSTTDPSPAPIKHTFRALFLDACIKSGVDLDILDQRYCYSLVLQHPENPLVCSVRDPKLYLIAVYSIDNSTLTVTRHPRSAIDWQSIGFKVPRDYTSGMTDPAFHGIRNRYANPNGATPYRIMGVVINASRGAGWSFKLRNPAYESAKHAPLESNKRLLYEYCNLRRTHDISAHLKMYPEDESVFNEFRDKIGSFTRLLYSSYIECFVAKKQPLIDYGSYLRPHMYRMHTDIYKPRRSADAMTAAATSPAVVVNATASATATTTTTTHTSTPENGSFVAVGKRGLSRGLKFQDAVQYVNLIMSPSELFHSLILIS